MKKFIIGIISWLPSDERRKERQERVIQTIKTCKHLFKDIPILIIAQNWKDFTIDYNKLIVKHYSKLGIVKARETLQKELLNYDFDYAILLDDDAIIYGDDSKGFLEHISKYDDGYCFRYYKEFSDSLSGRYMPAALNLCVISKKILQTDLINVKIDPEKEVGYEDQTYPILLYCKYPEKEIPWPIGTIFTSFRYGQKITSTWSNKPNKHWATAWQNNIKIIEYIKEFKEYPNFKQNKITKEITIYKKDGSLWGYSIDIPKHTFSSDKKSALYIHWFFNNRNDLKLNLIEKFHFLMMRKYELNKYFDQIIFVVALNLNKEDKRLENFISEQIFSNLSKEKTTIHFINNNADIKEKATFKTMISDLYNNSNDIDYYYIHFKGASHVNESEESIKNILFWVYLCYLGVFRKIHNSHLDEKAMCSYVHKNPECLGSQWYYDGVDERLMFPDYHNSGSFQAYKAKSFIECANDLGLNEKDISDIIDGGTPYVVEWLLTSIFPAERLDSLKFNPEHEYLSYCLFTNNEFSEYRDDFIKCYKEIK